jgi:hypothetical protein
MSLLAKVRCIAAFTRLRLLLLSPASCTRTSHARVSCACQREHRSLVCDVFESASRGATAVFIATQLAAPAEQASQKQQQQSIERNGGQKQTTTMLLLCSVACLYEIACRHWKLVRLLLRCIATVFL